MSDAEIIPHHEVIKRYARCMNISIQEAQRILGEIIEKAKAQLAAESIAS